MSHWSPERLSASLAGAFGRSPSGGPSASLSVATSCSTSTPNAAVDETPSIRLSRMSSPRNEVADDVAITTPIWSYSATTMPPALATSVDAVGRYCL